MGNRDLFGADFRWVDETDIASRSEPAEATYVERREYGPLIGTPQRLLDGEREVAKGPDATWQALEPLVARAHADRERVRDMERNQVGAINARLEAERLALRKLELGGKADAARRAAERQAHRVAPGGVHRRRSAAGRGDQRGIPHPGRIRRGRRHGEGPGDDRRVSSLSGQPVVARRSGGCVCEPAVGVPERRPARIQRHGGRDPSQRFSAP